jgi:DNA-binding HxlR family transcriptional regulator
VLQNDLSVLRNSRCNTVPCMYGWLRHWRPTAALSVIGVRPGSDSAGGGAGPLPTGVRSPKVLVPSPRTWTASDAVGWFGGGRTASAANSGRAVSANSRREPGSNRRHGAADTRVVEADPGRPEPPSPRSLVPEQRTGADPLFGAELHAQVVDAQAALQVLSGKWVVPIVIVLDAGPRRHGELQRALGPRLHQKVLTETLRRMEALGLLTRSVVAEIPPSVTYSLTDLGVTLVEPIVQLAAWAAMHGDELRTDRSRDSVGL